MICHGEKIYLLRNKLLRSSVIYTLLHFNQPQSHDSNCSRPNVDGCHDVGDGVQVAGDVQLGQEMAQILLKKTH